MYLQDTVLIMWGGKSVPNGNDCAFQQFDIDPKGLREKILQVCKAAKGESIGQFTSILLGSNFWLPLRHILRSGR